MLKSGWAFWFGVAGFALWVGLNNPAPVDAQYVGGAWTKEPRNSVRALSGVVSVLPILPKGQRPSQKEPEGSGVVLFDGKYVATAAHVLNRAIGYRVRTSTGLVRKARLVGQDRFTDIALLAVEPALSLAFHLPSTSQEVPLGGKACAIGNAFGLGVSISCGVVSAVNVSRAGFNPIEDFVQTDASVNPGMSGGALVDGSGRLIGMLSAIFTKQSDANIGVNFAVSLPLLQRVATELKDNGRVRRIASGLILSDGLARDGVGQLGARVVRIKPGSAAERAGFAVGDLLVGVSYLKHEKAVRGRSIQKPSDFVSFAATLPLPYVARAQVMRNGELRDINFSVGE